VQTVAPILVSPIAKPPAVIAVLSPADGSAHALGRSRGREARPSFSQSELAI